MSSVLQCGGLNISYEKSIQVERLPASLAECMKHSDIKPGVYEGGFKVWECCIDLCRYLVMPGNFDMKGNRVLELGCGAGLPGIVALKLEASHVCFQDFNDEVLQNWTKRNIEMNVDKDDATSRTSFVAGDWTDLTTLGNGFDLIITSETIYNEGNYAKLLAIMDKTLRPDGTILLAAKAYYFGVGGSVDGFLEAVTSNGIFSGEIVWSNENPSMIRHIVRLKRR